MNIHTKHPLSRSSSRGFTLAEIMLVVAILGVLVSVVLPRLTGRTEQARIEATRLQIENIGLALDAFEFDCGRYPTTLEGFSVLRTRAPGLPNWRGPYLRRALPRDPWGSDYVYRAPGARQPDYDLFSNGPDGLAGTEDDVGNW